MKMMMMMMKKKKKKKKKKKIMMMVNQNVALMRAVSPWNYSLYCSTWVSDQLVGVGVHEGLF